MDQPFSIWPLRYIFRPERPSVSRFTVAIKHKMAINYKLSERTSNRTHSNWCTHDAFLFTTNGVQQESGEALTLRNILRPFSVLHMGNFPLHSMSYDLRANTCVNFAIISLECLAFIVSNDWSSENGKRRNNWFTECVLFNGRLLFAVRLVIIINNLIFAKNK